MRLFFFFNDTATTEIYTLSLHDALPISAVKNSGAGCLRIHMGARPVSGCRAPPPCRRSEEHTSELQSQSNLVCRLLLEKKNKIAQSSRLDRRMHQRRVVVLARHDIALQT